MRKKNKKAWIRILEAFIAVMIIASVLMIIIMRTPRESSTGSVHEVQRFALEQVAANETLRGEVLEGSKDNTEIFIETVIPIYWNFTTEICEIEDICGMPFYIEKEVYADEILIATNLTKYSPKKLKLFVWAK